VDNVQTPCFIARSLEGEASDFLDRFLNKGRAAEGADKSRQPSKRIEKGGVNDVV
jgi:hypothetical protein